MTTATTPTDNRRINGPERQPTPRPADEQPPQFRPKWNILERQKDAARITELERRVIELETSIMNANRNQRALSIYGSPNALEEVTRQVSIAPQFKDLTPDEHRFVAGIALASGLNPVFHLHAWKEKKWDKEQKKNVETLRIVPDYKALIISTTEPIMIKERRLNVEEMRTRGISEQDITDGSIAYIVEGYNLKHAIMARQAGIEYEPKHGFGFWAAMKEKEEWSGPEGKRVKKTVRVPNDTPNTKDGDWVAKKRAMRDLFNQFADLRLKFAVPNGIESARVEEDEWILDQPPADSNVEEGEFTETTPTRADWLMPEGEARTAAYLEKMGVTHEQINAALDVEDWRQVPLAADEWKTTVDQLAGVSAETADPAPSLCTVSGCDQPGEVTPVGFLCPTHAHQKADAEAPTSNH